MAKSKRISPEERAYLKVRAKSDRVESERAKSGESITMICCYYVIGGHVLAQLPEGRKYDGLTIESVAAREGVKGDTIR
jgi:hypothetical protein